MGLIVSDLLRKKESMQQLKDALPSWCSPEQAQQLGMLKVMDEFYTYVVHLLVLNTAYAHCTYPYIAWSTMSFATEFCCMAHTKFVMYITHISGGLNSPHLVHM